jgi:hypothetical protein
MSHVGLGLNRDGTGGVAEFLHGEGGGVAAAYVFLLLLVVPCAETRLGERTLLPVSFSAGTSF